MLPVLIGLVAALLFSLVTYSVYGLDGVMTLAWIDQVFWALIVAGILVAALNAFWSCLGCRLSKKLFGNKLAETICEESACKQ